MTKRKSVSNKIRFEVFKRDCFTCQYCGLSSPKVVLEVDHIEPVSKGGSNNILNLITACKECNSGKSNRLISDGSAVEKQVIQLTEIQERRNQLQMMKRWRDECLKIDAEQLQIVIDQLEVFYEAGVCDEDKPHIAKAIKKFGLNSVLDAVQVAVERYEWHVAPRKLYGICAFKLIEQEDPDKAKLIYARNILKKRFGHDFNEASFWFFINQAVELGGSVDSAVMGAKKVGSFREFMGKIKQFIQEAYE